MKESKSRSEFVFEGPAAAPIGSALYQEHLELSSKSRIADFAGYLMPLWHSSISAEHRAVRSSAGLFDCTHMGILEVFGPQSMGFLDVVTTNETGNLQVRNAQYSYILDAEGKVLDDIIVYRRAEYNFMVVVNAANEPKIKAYFAALLGDEVIIDTAEPERTVEDKPQIRDMRDANSGTDCRVDIALQGPAALGILLRLIDDEKAKNDMEKLKPFGFIETRMSSIECLISHTGYTGAKVGFELFVHPDKVRAIWTKLLEHGKSFGLVPCGLGARDSLRIEAGLPLYGHELAGEFDISPFEAGYGWAVKLEKKFFIGKAAMQKRAKTCNMKVARVELPGTKGIRPVRQKDGVVEMDGRCIGWVLSSANVGKKQIALVYVGKEQTKEGQTVGIYYLARSKGQKEQGRKEDVLLKEQLTADITGKVVSRFAKF